MCFAADNGEAADRAAQIDGSGALAAGFAAVLEGGITPTRFAYLCSACQFEQRPQLPLTVQGGSSSSAPVM
jgi:hypothetical protein